MDVKQISTQMKTTVEHVATTADRMRIVRLDCVNVMMDSMIVMV